ncbi:MAG TPA: hypothetical protein VET48_05350 [Steroidobacteraceae bacterium]|nr:hypothetical protein [Steroidobacteraceae bacterium]
MNIKLLSGRNAFSVFAICALALLAISADAATKKLATAKSDSPRLADGKPDLTGVWANDEMGFVNPQRDAKGSVLCIVGCPQKPAADGTATPPPRPPRAAPARPKYKPEFEAKVKELSDKQVQLDPALKCGNPGLPRIGPPDAIVQRPGQIVFLYEDLSGSFFRMIPTDGRAHRTDAEETYLGDSVGKWDGDTLVVEAVKFTDETWLTDNGAFHTSGLKVTERLRRVGDKLEYQAVAEDPAVLVEPWQLRARTLKLSDEPLHEPLPCVDKDLDHIVDGTHHDNPR